MDPKEQSLPKVGRYELVRKIATGGMAELFLARFTGPGGFEKRCAVKSQPPSTWSHQAVAASHQGPTA